MKNWFNLRTFFITCVGLLLLSTSFLYTNCSENPSKPHSAPKSTAVPQVDTPPVVCADILCAAPPVNCVYSGEPHKDANGCQISCGELKCDHKIICPMIACPVLLPEKCQWTGETTLLPGGCPGCPEFKCDNNLDTK